MIHVGVFRPEGGDCATAESVSACDGRMNGTVLRLRDAVRPCATRSAGQCRRHPEFSERKYRPTGSTCASLRSNAPCAWSSTVPKARTSPTVLDCARTRRPARVHRVASASLSIHGLDVWRCPSCQGGHRARAEAGSAFATPLPLLGALSSPSTTTRADETRALHVTRVHLDERAQPRAAEVRRARRTGSKHARTERELRSRAPTVLTSASTRATRTSSSPPSPRRSASSSVDAVAEAEAAEAEVARVVGLVRR